MMNIIGNITQQVRFTFQNHWPAKNTLFIGGLSIIGYLVFHYLNRSNIFRHPLIENLKYSSTVDFKESLSSEEDLACQLPPNIHDWNGFFDYRAPNEGTPINVKPHMDMMEKGWIVSVGTERSFYDLLLSSLKMCEGLIIRDINPRVKAYCDFLILLLRISKSRKEFVELTKMPLEKLREIIIPRIHQSDLSEKMKSYYINHFDDLGSCYLGIRHWPDKGDNTGVEYFKEDALFNKLQRYAKAGRIIATVGSIDDLRFVGNRKVTLIDVSNVPGSTPLFFYWNGGHAPRIIETECGGSFKTSYMSGVCDTISPNLKIKMDELLRSESITDEILRLNVDPHKLYKWNKNENPFNQLPSVLCYTFYTTKNYFLLKNAVKNNTLRRPSDRVIPYDKREV